MSVLTVASLFALCALVIVVAGARLSYYGDVIAERSGFGQAWVGVIALASVTSLPELATGVSASLIAAPEIALGDVVGSCLFNLVLLGALDLFSPTPVLTRLRSVHTLSAALGAALLIGVAFVLVTAPAWPVIRVAGTHVGAMSPLLLLGYLLAVRAVFRYERQHDQVTDDNILAPRYAHLSLRSAVLRYSGAAVVLVVAAANVPGLAVALADATGLAQSFVGTALVAASTSLPEVAVSIAAVRLGAWDLAAANVLGSNLFNVAILALDDIAYRDGALLAAVSPSHAVTALGAAAMSVLVIVTLITRPAPLTGRVTSAFLAMCAIYTLVTVLAF